MCNFQPIDFVAVSPHRGEDRWLLWPFSFSFLLSLILLHLSPSFLPVLSSLVYLLGVHLLRPFPFWSIISFQRILLRSSKKVCRVTVTPTQVFTTSPFSLCLPLLAVLSMVFPRASFIFWLGPVRCLWLEDRISLRFISTVLLGGRWCRRFG